MQLKLAKLQKVVKKVINEERYFDALKDELTRALGPTVVTTHGLRIMAESANDRLDVILRTSRQPEAIKTAVLLKFINSEDPEARRLVARLLPETFVRKMLFDSDFSVRVAAASRLPSFYIKEAIKRNPGDDELMSVYRQKKLHEAGLPDPKLLAKPLDINGEEPLGDTAKYDEHPGMTDQWYDSLARDIIKMYGKNLEANWEENAVKNYVNGQAAQGIEVDRDKLIDAVYDLLSQREKNSIELSEGRSLSSIVRQLREEDMMSEAVMPIIPESVDPIKELVKNAVSPVEYIKMFENLFNVNKSSVANPGRKQGINENVAKVIAPATAMFPSAIVRSIDEKAVDLYVRHWNSQRQLRNQPYRISWMPTGKSNISFNLGIT
jgi:hypothetical protein